MTNSKSNPSTETKSDAAKPRRARLLQEDVPSCNLEQALRVPRAIAENYAFKPTRPLNIAQAIGMTPTSGPFRSLTGAAAAYGLTTSAAQATEVGLTSIGLRIVRPTSEGDDIAAKREALLRPKLIGEFLRNYDGAALPTDTIAKNVLQEMGVPSERVSNVLEMITESARTVGFIREWNGKTFIDLTATGSGDTQGSPLVAPDEPTVTKASNSLPVATTSPISATVGTGIHVNIEIHIAADASSDTIEDIFRNMRRYVLNDGNQAEGNADDK
jgi:hypothetical protein